MTYQEMINAIEEMGLTATEISMKSGVSIGTVYRVIHGDPVKAKTRIKVLIAVKELSTELRGRLAS